MKRWLIILALCTQAWAAPLVVQQHSATSSTNTLGANTTIGNYLGVYVSSSTASTGTVKIGTQTLVLQGICSPAVSSTIGCLYAAAPLTVASTSLTCTSCGTFNYSNAVEYSGVNGVEPIVGCFTASGVCQQNNAGTIVGIQYQPGYSAEGVLFGITCSASSGSPTLTGLTGGGTANPGSNPTGWGISSGTTLTSLAATSACLQMTALGMAFTGTGATQQPIANPDQFEVSAVATSGNATVAASNT